MKKLLLTSICLLAITVLNSQSLEEIINKYTTSNKLDKISDYKTLKITAKMSMMGMEMPMEMWMKNPDKIKTVTRMNGQEIVQVFDGEKGYMINPMTGSAVPTEMTAGQIKDMQRSNAFQNTLANYLKNGQLTLDGEDNISGKPVYKIKAVIEGGTSATIFIDKASFLILKTIADINQEGMAMTVESYPSDYTETNGVLLPMKTTTSMNGMEMIMNFTKVEVDVPIDDSVFKVK